MPAPRILLITTSHTQMGKGNKATGVWAEEFTTPFWFFTDVGANVSVASIQGGRIPFDPRSLAGDEDAPASLRRFLASPKTVQAIADTTSPVDLIDIDSFDACLLVGGHGTMWDFPAHDGLAKLISLAYQMNKPIAAVCHGVAGLVTAKLSNGDPLIKDKRLTSFTNSEEEAVGLTDVVPFLLESKLKALGARYECGSDFEPYAVRDGNLITGQNPASSALVARRLCESLGLV